MTSLGGDNVTLNKYSGLTVSWFVSKMQGCHLGLFALISLAAPCISFIAADANPALAEGSSVKSGLGTSFSIYLSRSKTERKGAAGLKMITVQNTGFGELSEKYQWSDLPEWRGVPDARFNERPHNETADQVAESLYNKAYTKLLVGDLDSAEQEFQRIILHYAQSPIAHKAQIALGKVEERRRARLFSKLKKGGVDEGFDLPTSSIEQWSDSARYQDVPLGESRGLLENKTPHVTVSGSLKGARNDFINNVGDRVFFKTRSATLTEEAKSLLTAQATWLKANKSYNLLIEGHADEKGSEDYNMTLSANRAASVEQFFVQAEIDPGRIKTRHYGRGKRVAICKKESCSEQNRRVVTRLLKGE